MWAWCFFLCFFFFNDTATTEIYTLSLHDALPISDIGRFFAEPSDISFLALRPGFLMVGVRSKAVGQHLDHARNIRAEIVLDVLEPQFSPLIFGSVMKKGGDHHVFGDRAPGVAGLTHDQGCNSQKMRHVWNIGTLAPLDVEDTRIFDCARKPAGQVQLSARLA